MSDQWQTKDEIWFDQIMLLDCDLWLVVIVLVDFWKPEARAAPRTGSTATERPLFKEERMYWNSFILSSSTKGDYLRKVPTIKVQVHVDKNDLFQFSESFSIKGGDVEEVLVVPATKETFERNSAFVFNLDI